MRAGLKVARATKLILTAKSMEIFGIPLPAMLSQLLLGLVNGSFYAILSLGLAVIFGLLNVINFAHGALFMLGAMLAWMGLSYFGLPYWAMLVLAPLIVGAFGIDRAPMLRWLYKLDHLYGLLLTFGLTLVIEGVFRSIYGCRASRTTCPRAVGRDQSRLHVPAELPRLGGRRVARGVLATWFVIEKTSWAPTCAPAPRTRSWSRRSASTCR
jgi:branched-chain amino acid transport system permease protein